MGFVMIRDFDPSEDTKESVCWTSIFLSFVLWIDDIFKFTVDWYSFPETLGFKRLTSTWVTFLLLPPDFRLRTLFRDTRYFEYRSLISKPKPRALFCCFGFVLRPGEFGSYRLIMPYRRPSFWKDLPRFDFSWRFATSIYRVLNPFWLSTSSGPPSRANLLWRT